MLAMTFHGTYNTEMHEVGFFARAENNKRFGITKWNPRCFNAEHQVSLNIDGIYLEAICRWFL